MFLGYARVSTEDQNLDLQRDALKAAGCTTIYEEKATGKHLDGRHQLTECLRSLRAGDTLIVWKLDRLGRSILDLIKIVTELQSCNIQFRSLTEQIDTSTPTGAFTFHIFSALAELERSRIRERTMAGLSAARARGRKGGSKPKTSPQQDKQMLSLWETKKHTAREIATQFNISIPTFFRRIAAMNAPVEDGARKRGPNA